MAHWAEIDENNIVLRVTVGDNNDPNGDEGYQWLIDNLGGTWIQTSYNATIRKKFAGIGDVYDEELDGFKSPQPYPSWVFNSEIWAWEAPISIPNDFIPARPNYGWKESTQEWFKQPDSGFWLWDSEAEIWLEK